MFVKINCPVCGSEAYHNISLSTLEHMNFEGEKQAYRYIIENIEVKGSLPEEDFIRSILQGMRKIIYDGIEVEVLRGILEENYGVTGACCMDLIERIQLELDMYCPDRKRLYFAETEELGSYTKKKTFYLTLDPFSTYLTCF